MKMPSGGGNFSAKIELGLRFQSTILEEKIKKSVNNHGLLFPYLRVTFFCMRGTNFLNNDNKISRLWIQKDQKYIFLKYCKYKIPIKQKLIYLLTLLK